MNFDRILISNIHMIRSLANRIFQPCPEPPEAPEESYEMPGVISELDHEEEPTSILVLTVSNTSLVGSRLYQRRSQRSNTRLEALAEVYKFDMLLVT